ncbi:hypothetical protein MBLNU230_g4539t1 [Neophaeotheca triangularis]
MEGGLRRRRIALGVDDGVDGRNALFRRRKLGGSSKSLWLFVARFALAFGAVSFALVGYYTLASLLFDGPLISTPFLPNYGQPGENLLSHLYEITRNTTPIPCHSHNDYWRRIPLLTALHAGCISVEADIWHFPSDDNLYVGHDTASLTPSRTLQNLYIDPLLTLLDAANPNTTNSTNHPLNGVFTTHPTQPLILLLDLKTHHPTTLPHILHSLEPLLSKSYLTTHNPTTNLRTPGPLTITATGATPYSALLALEPTTQRTIFYDAKLTALTTPAPDLPPYSPATASTASAPLIKSLGLPLSWRQFPLLWQFSPSQLEILRQRFREARSRGLVVRYWDLPAWPGWWRRAVWRGLVRVAGEVGEGGRGVCGSGGGGGVVPDCGVLLNVDDVEGVARGEWGVW